MNAKKIISLLLAMMLIILAFAGCAKKDDEQGAVTNPPEEPSETVEGISYEEGTSDRDNIVNTTAAEKVLLVVSFGTSYNLSRFETIGGIEVALQAAYPDYQIRRAFTSQIIIDKLAARDSLRIDNIGEAMDRLVLDKVKEVVIQPTTVMNGHEYDDVIAAVMPYADKFDSLKIGKWLLADDEDYDAVVEAMVAETSEFRAEGTAIVFMGHGTTHESNSTYTKLQDLLFEKGYDDYLIGTVEGYPELDDVQELLEEMGVTKVVLRPLMIVAGDHANNDMAGDEEDSWKVILTEDGYEVETVLEGLGQVKGIQDVFVKHVQDALDSAELSETPTIAAGLSAVRIQNGTYSIEVESDTSMFRIVDCQLTVEDDSMSAVMTLSAQGYSHVYMGTGEEALADDDSNISEALDNEERHAFIIPIEALDKGLDCAGKSARTGDWYDHVVVFKSDSISDDAFLPSQIDVEMEGGSGRVSVQSPAQLTYKGGVDYAEIIWSSSNYSYMLVDGVEYLPETTEETSTFEIPIVLDKAMTVIACTTAMGNPREIEYILIFDSASIK